MGFGRMSIPYMYYMPDVIFLESEELSLKRFWNPLTYHWTRATRCTTASPTIWCVAAPVDPERCRSVGDGHSAMQPHSPVLHQLHWLPVRQRVAFKVATLVYQALSEHAPSYLADDCCLVTDARPRRETSQLDFESGTVCEWISNSWTSYMAVSPCFNSFVCKDCTFAYVQYNAYYCASFCLRFLGFLE